MEIKEKPDLLSATFKPKSEKGVTQNKFIPVGKDREPCNNK